MDLLNEHADSQDTMAIVMEMLEEKLLDVQKWVVLVGDGKTFEHLQKVKSLECKPLHVKTSTSGISSKISNQFFSKPTTTPA